ncbi:MAG: PEGA domain-containing protein [candidate division KSB1 bacterium]|nr:PEGA domain-containing protein [candidate division KSB1 bacterium]MDZ7367028.1 PEGA domain-containing protein [candidate division KSB1 bacterium]MDZ7406728.1 PEGA domain-containing protein [candidate division KSB1 bacterium]
MKFHLIAFSSVTLWVVCTITFAQQAESTGHAVISVESQYPGLPILIDGKEAGFTPLQNHLLPPGKHEIAVKRAQPESWLDFDWVETCSLSAGDTLHFTAHFQKGYSINSMPFGAEVYLDGVLQGTTPLVLRLPEDEIAYVEIRKAGYQAEQLQIGKTKEGLAETRLYAVTLKPEKDWTVLHEDEASRRRFHLTRNRRISLAAAGLSLASGVAAILLKDKADHFYDQYLTTGLPAQREKFYQRTKDYDRYSGIATAVFETSFAVSFYFFLKSTAE